MNPTILYGIILGLSLLGTQGMALYSEQRAEQERNQRSAPGREGFAYDHRYANSVSHADPDRYDGKGSCCRGEAVSNRGLDQILPIW